MNDATGLPTQVERFDSWDDFLHRHQEPTRRVHSTHKRARTAMRVAREHGLIFVQCVDTNRTWYRVEYPD